LAAIGSWFTGYTAPTPAAAPAAAPDVALGYAGTPPQRQDSPAWFMTQIAAGGR
jgi:hypothetical protein